MKNSVLKIFLLSCLVAMAGCQNGKMYSDHSIQEIKLKLREDASKPISQKNQKCLVKEVGRCGCGWRNTIILW